MVERAERVRKWSLGQKKKTIEMSDPKQNPICKPGKAGSQQESKTRQRDRQQGVKQCKVNISKTSEV